MYYITSLRCCATIAMSIMETREICRLSRSSLYYIDGDNVAGSNDNPVLQDEMPIF